MTIKCKWLLNPETKIVAETPAVRTGLVVPSMHKTKFGIMYPCVLFSDVFLGRFIIDQFFPHSFSVFPRLY